MKVTALSLVIGYDKAAAISDYAIDNDLTLRQAAMAKGVDARQGRGPLALTPPGTADVPSSPKGF